MRRRLIRFLVAISASLVVISMASPSVYADCVDAYNHHTYCSSELGCVNASVDYFYAQVATQNGSCYWKKNPLTLDYASYCPYVYQTQGGKTNLSTGGNPYTYTNVDHVAAYIQSLEQGNVNSTTGCQTGGQTQAYGCWVQVGWTDGYGTTAPGCSNQTTVQTNSTVDVFVEIYDDSSAPCLLGTFGAAPSNASYDARFYTTLSNGLHRYQVYFEVPGSGNIQNLAYADFRDLTTAETVTGEAKDQLIPGAGTPDCPVLAQTIVGDWDVAGQPASQATFASYMNLYTGSWQNWTTSVAPHTQGYIWPLNGADKNGVGSSSNPYQYQAISNWSAGDYTEWEFGGPTN